MTCQQLIDRIATLSQNFGNSPALEALHQQTEKGVLPTVKQLQASLQEDLQQRQRLSAQIQTLTRQLSFYLQWEDQPTVSLPSFDETQDTLEVVAEAPLPEPKSTQGKLNSRVSHQQGTEVDYQRYQNLFQLAPDGYLTTDAQGQVLEANLTAGDLLGVDRQELVGQSLLTFLTGADEKEQLLQAMQTIAEQEKSVEKCEARISPQQGSPFFAALRLSLIQGSAGEALQFGCLLQDISEQQQIYQALTAGEKKWRALFDQSFQIIALLDETGKVIDLNQTALELVQSHLPQIRHHHFSEIPWWRSEADRAQIKQSIKLAQIGGMVRYEAQLLSDSGELVPIDLSLKPVRDEAGQVVLLIAEGRDLRDRVQKEAERYREKEISDSILKSLPGVFYMIEKNGPCVRWNQELEKITGYNTEEISAIDPLQFFIESDRAHVEDKIQEALSHGKSTTEATFLNQQGTIATCYLSHVCVNLEEEQGYVVGVGINITETNPMKNEHQKLAALVENSKDFISLTSLEGEVEFLNPGGQRLLGVDGVERLSLSLKDCFLTNSEEQFDQKIFPSIFKTGQWSGELAVRNHQTGAVLPVLANIFVVRDLTTSTPINLGVITRNISHRKQTEIALKTSEQRFRSIFEQAAVGIALLDLAGRFQRVNQRGCEILGYSQKELVTRTYHDLIAIEQIATDDSQIRELLRGERDCFCQAQHYHRKDNSWVWVSLTMSLLRDLEGKPQSLVAILEDISDHKETEAAWQQSEQAYRSLVDGIREVIFRVNTNGLWCFLNPAWTEITGYRISETIGQPFLNYIYFEDLAYHQKQFQKLLNNPDYHCRYEIRYQTQAGGFCWMEVTARVTRNENGIITGITGTLNEVTERRQAEDQLRAVINTVPGLVSWVSRDGYYLGVNEQLANTLNLEPEDFLGKEIGFLNTNSSFVRFMYEFLASEEIETSQVLENTIKNGETRSFLVAAQKYRQASAAVLIGIDITERKQAELALQESENQFRQLAENIEQVFWMVDLARQSFIYISPAYESTWGRSLQSAYDSPTDWLQSVHPEDYQHVLDSSRKQIRGEYNEEYRIIRPNGEMRWIHDRAFPVRNDQGKVYRIAGIAEDITERKQAKEALQKRERYLKALVGVQRRLLASTVDQALYQEVLGILGEACAANRIYVYENFVDEQGRLRGRKCAQWYSDRIYYPKFDEQLYFCYENLGSECYQKLQQGEFLQKTVTDLPPATQAFFREQNIISFLMLPLMVNGEFFGVIGFDNYEIARNWGRLEVGLLSSAAAAIALAKEKQLTQETLQQQLTAIETTTDGIMIIQAGGKLHYVNPAYCKMLGYDAPETLVNTQWRDHHPLEELSRINEEIFPQLQRHGCWSGEIYAQRRDGSTFIQELSMNLIRNGEIVGVCRDISERKEGEEQLQASLEEKDLLLKEVHHRVKNNLQVISSIFSLQSQTIEDEQALAILEESQNRISSMALIHEKLYQATNLANIDFAEYIRDLIYHLLASYNINPDWVQTEMNIQSIQLNLDSAIPCGLLINELVSNSLKHGFTNQHQGKIYIFLGVIDEAQEMISLKVEDDGVGLPEGFNPEKNSSLGVSLITSLTQQLRGTLKFQNNPGASFEITFPKPIERKRF
ncbi:MAG: PAS domain S-box protein [Cyanobacteria bacterium]|jgi:PAS domain S-box-containing protein|nr:PAS domain S-box protein [Cyanobacteria bacterium GSL.Bin1]